MVEIETAEGIRSVTYSARQHLVDNFTDSAYYPNERDDICAKCGMPSVENIMGIQFCNRHIGGVKRGMERFMKERDKMEKWNRGAAKNEA